LPLVASVFTHVQNRPYYRTWFHAMMHSIRSSRSSSTFGLARASQPAAAARHCHASCHTNATVRSSSSRRRACLQTARARWRIDCPHCGPSLPPADDAVNKKRAYTPEPIDPKQCHFMLPSRSDDLDDLNDPLNDDVRFILWHDASLQANAPTPWSLKVEPAQAILEINFPDSEIGPPETAQTAVGIIHVRPKRPFLFVKFMGIHERYQELGYGTAFAKRLGTFLSRKAYGFTGCTNVTLCCVSVHTFSFWKKAVGVRHFMRSVDAFFGVDDLTGGGLPSEEQLRMYWDRVCVFDEWVIEELVREWRKRVQRALQRKAARHQKA
jgi:hypothetical protein